MRTRIELGSNGDLDVKENLSYSLNFAIADIRTPDKRDASYSKTIKIPGSKINDDMFSYIFEIDIDCNFNPNIKTPCTIYIDEIPQMTGYLQLLRITSLDSGMKEYEVTIKGQVGNLFTAIGDDELTELDLTSYNHTYNKATQKASWTLPIGEGYVYPMVDYGLNNGLTYDVKHFYPAVYLKEYIDKIFEYAGYSYNSDFFNTTFFKRLIIPYNGKGIKLTEAQIEPRVFSAELTTLQSFFTYPGGYQRIKYNNELLDPSNAYNPALWEWVCPNTGYYDFTASAELKTTSGTASGQLMIARDLGAGVNPQSVGSVGVYITTTYSTHVVGALNIFCNAGEKYSGYTLVGASPNTTININSGNFYNTPLNSGVVDGESIDMSQAIPLKVKMKDLLKSVIQAFNLYVEVDKGNELILNIEPRDDFYSAGSTKDWTNKLDVSREIIQEPMGALDAKKYIFTYSDDKDYYNTLYKDEFFEAYGTHNFNIENDFLTTTKENKIIFCPTPLYDGSGTDRIISAIIPPEFTVTELKGCNLRLLYYGGVFNTTSAWSYTSVGGTTSETTYPYAGHLDNPSDPTLDINFGVPREVNYLTGVYTDNNLYNGYHKKFIDEICHKDSKIITCWLYLTPKDILLLDFRDQFYIDGHLLRLNKIFDYNFTQSEVTKCEFIKIKYANPIVTQVLYSDGGIDKKF